MADEGLGGDSGGFWEEVTLMLARTLALLTQSLVGCRCAARDVQRSGSLQAKRYKEHCDVTSCSVKTFGFYLVNFIKYFAFTSPFLIFSSFRLIIFFLIGFNFSVKSFPSM